MNISNLLDQLFGQGLPPTIEDVKVYFSQKGLPELEAEHFFIVHERRHWRTRRGTVIRNWKASAYRWILGVWLWNPVLFERNAR